MAANDIEYGKPTIEDVNAKAEAKVALFKKYLSDKEGWSNSVNDGVTLEAKSFPESPISCFKISGLLPCSIEAAAKYAFSPALESRQRQDPTVENMELLATLAPNVIVTRQTNKLPWPLWGRQTLLALYKTIEPDGSVILVAWSVHDDKFKVDTTQYVETKCFLVGTHIFKDAASGQTKLIRLLHVDPAGSIPAWVVDLNTANLPLIIKDIRTHAK